MKRIVIFIFCLFCGTLASAEVVTRYTAGGEAAATAASLYGVMTSGTPAASGDVVKLSGDAVRGTSVFTLGANKTLTIQSDSSLLRALTMGTDESGRFLTAESGTNLFLKNVSFSGGAVTDSGVCGGAILSSGTVTLENVTFSKNTTGFANSSRGGAINGSVILAGGANVFTQNQAGEGGAVGGSITISGGRNTFSENKSRGNDAGVNRGLLKITAGENFFTNNTALAAGGVTTELSISGGENIFEGNHGQYGGVLHGKCVISGGNNVFRGNTANYGGVVNNVTSLSFTGGTTLFENNVSAFTGTGGAINIWFDNRTVQFSGDDTTVIFRGNYNRADRVMNDISLRYSNKNTGNAVVFTGNGTYYFGGGIKIPTLTMNGGNITFGEGSHTDLTAAYSDDVPVWTLKNTNLTIRYGSVVSPLASTTSFKIGASDGAVADGGGNTMKLVLSDSYFASGSDTLISGNASGLKTVPSVILAGDTAGFAYVSRADADGVKITKVAAPSGKLAHLGAADSASGAAAQMLKESRNTLYSASAAGVPANNDVFLLTGDITRGAQAVTTAAGLNLTIRSASETPRTISMGTGETGRFLSASGTSLTLENVRFSGASIASGDGGAIQAAAVTLRGNTAFTNNAALNGKGGAVAGDVTILGADSHILFSGNKAVSAAGAADGGAISGTLTIQDGTNIFEKNTASLGGGQFGGGVAVSAAIHGGTNSFTENSAQLGGVFRGLTITGGTNSFTGNQGVWGGVIYGTLNISGGVNTFDGNTADNGVGGITQGDSVISGGTTYFTNNRSTSWGGALFMNAFTTFSGEDTYVYFDGNVQKYGTAGVESKNDIYAFHDTDVLTFSGNGTYYFGGGISTRIINVNGGNVTLADGSVSNGSCFNAPNAAYSNLTQTGGSITLHGTAVLQANAAVSGGSLNFEAAPETDGFGTLIASAAPTLSGSGKMTVGMQGVTAMKNGKAYTLIQGVNVSSDKFTYNKNLFSLENSGADTVLKLMTSGTLGDEYGEILVNKYIAPGLSDGDAIDVKEYSLEIQTADLNAFADWFSTETGYDAVVGNGHVSFALNNTVSLFGNDHFVWDFSDYGTQALLRGVVVNQMADMVPEPSAFTLLLLLGAGIFGLRIRTGKKA